MRIFAARWPAETAGLVLVDPAHPEDWLRPAPKEQVLIDRGVELCRLGARASKVGVSRAVAALAGMGALAPAWALTSWFTKGKISARDNQILAPMWKLPPDARKPLRHFWTRVAFYQALGSHIETISMSAAETLTASAGGYGDLPLVTISSTDPGSYRLAQQEALAKLSTRGRHFVATRSSHWIPLDQPDLIVAVVRGLVASVRIA
jgi:pimeloyl-ACP methyl ester carboxylesterase